MKWKAFIFYGGGAVGVSRNLIVLALPGTHTRAVCTAEHCTVPPARVGVRMFPQAWRAEQDKRDSKRGTRANREREFLQAWRAEQDKRDPKRGTRASREAEESLCRVD